MNKKIPEDLKKRLEVIRKVKNSNNEEINNNINSSIENYSKEQNIYKINHLVYDFKSGESKYKITDNTLHILDIGCLTNLPELRRDGGKDSDIKVNSLYLGTLLERNALNKLLENKLIEEEYKVLHSSKDYRLSHRNAQLKNIRINVNNETVGSMLNKYNTYLSEKKVI